MQSQLFIGFILALATGIIGYLFWCIERKIDHMETENETHHREQIEIRVAERELLLASSDISALCARCIRGEKVNGDLEQAEQYLIDKKHAVQDLTRKIALEHMEERS